MITQLGLKNFKSWREANVDFAPITAIFGTNSSGKSSLLQALLLIKQTVESADREIVLQTQGDGTTPRLGGVVDLLHKRDKLASLDLRIEWVSQFPFHSELVEFERFLLESRIALNQDGFAEVTELRYKALGRNIHPEQLVATSKGIRLTQAGQELDFPAGGDQPRLTLWRIPSSWLLRHPSLDQFASTLQLRLLAQLKNSSFIGPLRLSPQRSYSDSDAAPSSVGYDGGSTIAVLIASMKSGTNVIASVSEWLGRLGLADSFDVRATDEARRTYSGFIQCSGQEVLLPDVGFGISQILPILVECLATRRGSTVIIEQPELHLHPKAQAELADFFIFVAKDRGVQLIIESHSEHLLQRLQRRLAEGPLVENGLPISPEDVALYFTRLESGESKLDRLEMDEYGNIKNWPKDFFGDPLGEALAKADAEMKRQGFA